ncbi:hypothetical protein NKR19_g1608 [Coniochaeta hoffmannii]|uniref:Alpha-type protein kinase domain-containing protein n=1 Tax=Coniochaeta hoffmannii TaxID=91930 RepID=A0AA38S0H4_9PEZI|nr:hypothetical protein NKR19_g1608 [Coniochaeta hoffmannii]
MGRICADCRRDLPQSSYAANQYRKPGGVSRCAACIHGQHSDTLAVHNPDSGRYNDCHQAIYTPEALDYPFAEGAFRWVAKGNYTHGVRKGQAAVCKRFKAGTVFFDDYFAFDIKAVDKALDIVSKFNELNMVNREIKINVPDVWTFDDGDYE